jgi:hypothetical protein
MPADLQTVKEYGKQYFFGIGGSDAPDIGGGAMVCTSADLKYESEIFVQAQNGEGVTDSCVANLPESRMITGTFTGYITADISGTLSDFSYLDRFFIVKSVGIPKKKGEYWEVSVEAQSFPLISG